MCLILPSLLLAQRYKKKKNSVPKIFVGFGSGLYSSNIIIEEDLVWKLLYADDTKWKRGNGNLIKINFGYGINNKIDISTGLSFNKYSVTQTTGFGYWACDLSLYGATKIEKAERIVHLNSIEIPIEARYKFEFEKLILFPSIGFNTMFYTKINQTIEMTLDNGVIANHDNNDIELEHNRNYNLSLITKIGVGYRITKRWFLKLEPFYKYHIGQDEILTDFKKTNISSIGVQIGFEYALKFIK